MDYFRFDHPEMLWLGVLAVPVLWLGFRSLEALDPARRWASIGLRLAVLILLVLMLAGFQAVRRHTDLTVVAVVDQSESVRRFAQPPGADADPNGQTSFEQWARHYLQTAGKGRKTDDRFAMVTFDGRPTVRSMPGASMDLDASIAQQPVEGTDAASAIRLAMALFPPDSGKRLLLVYDGNNTAAAGSAYSDPGDSGDVLAAAREAAGAGVPIDVLPVIYNLKKEVMVEGVYAPSQAREGQTVALRIVLRAAQPTAGTLHLKHDGVSIDVNGPAPGKGAPISHDDWTAQQAASAPVPTGLADEPARAASAAGRYVCVRMIEVPMGMAGTNQFEAVFEPEPGADAMAANNQAQTFTLVHGKGKVLFVDNLGPGPGDILPKTLVEHGIELDLVRGRGLPARLADLQRYDAVIFQNVPAEMVTPAQQRMLAKYVNDLGGGFVMVGGPDSFGAGGWTNSPIDQILPVECQIPSQTIMPSGALVLVLDRSGSMGSFVAGTQYSQQEIANEAAILALHSLYPQDLVGVVAFDNSAKWIVKLQFNSDPQMVTRKVRSIHPGGGTSIYPALVQAYQALAPITPEEAAVKHVSLLTDGHSQSGQYHVIVGKMAQANITLSTIGVGDGHDTQLLSQLAMMSGGTYHPVVNPQLLPQIFIKEARTIRKNLVKEVTFDPQMVPTGSPIVTGLAAPPPLTGLVLTGEKHDPRVFMPMLGPEGEPLFAHWQVGLGRSAAFTSDATNRWATAWLRWGGYPDFWSRTVRAVARPSASREFDLVTAVRGDRLTIRLDASGADTDATGVKRGGSFANFLTVVGSVLRPDGEPVPVELKQTGPGIYEARVRATDAGNYIVSLFVSDPSGRDAPRAVFGGVSRPPGSELRTFSSNRAVLEQIAQITGGRVLDPASPATAALFTRESVVESRSIRPLWRPLLLWLLVAFLLDVACRRIAWDVVAMKNWAVERVAAFGQWLKPREVEAAATLSALKRRAAQVDQRLASSASPSVAPPPAATRKFEAEPDAVAAEDFSDAVGAAKDSPTKPRRTTPVGTAETSTEQTDTTSRLLDAKRRARQRMNETDE
ncbi:MAG: VWA domain-containing protein [Phycisphaeraceae bacterium]